MNFTLKIRHKLVIQFEQLKYNFQNKYLNTYTLIIQNEKTITQILLQTKLIFKNTNMIRH